MRVVVIGAGFAGLSAAIALQERRHQVLLLERRGVLGGRATSFRDAASGEDVDNGTHLMVGAYAATFDLLRRAGAEDLLLAQDRLRLDYVDERGFTSLDCPSLPAPLHLLAGLLGLRLPWRARWDAVRLWLAVRYGRVPSGMTLAEYFRETGQSDAARRLLWDPLATAILNESPERAAAVLFHRVYQEAFLAGQRASRLVFLRRGFGVLHERLAAYFERRGGKLVRRARAEGILLDGGRAGGVGYAQGAMGRDAIRTGESRRTCQAAADAVVAAVPPPALCRLLPEAMRSEPPFAELARLGSSPIVSVELWLDRVVLERPFVGLRGCEVEWVFDKGRLFGRQGTPQHLAFIVSAARRSLARNHAELAGAAEGALRRYFPAMAQARVARALVLREPDATFASDPATERLRPAAATPVQGLFLAGDWTATGLPATIEGAVRSGFRAAEAVERGS